VHCTCTAESANVNVQNTGNYITCGINCDYRITSTEHTAVYIICFKYIIINTLHTGGCCGDNDYDDNDNNNNNCVLRFLFF
jgi:hypothetical protein